MSSFEPYVDKLYKKFRTPKNYMLDGAGYAIVYDNMQHVRSEFEGVNECEIHLTIYETKE